VRNNKHFTLINVARLTPIKGHREFLKSIKLVAKKIKDVKVLVVGDAEKGKGAYFKELKELSAKLGISKNIKFLGYRNDINELLVSADCLVLSSNVPEGFGRVIIEAGAVGTPCCASDIGGIKEIISSEERGLLFPPGDEIKMAEAIIRLLKDDKLRHRCVKNLRGYVEENFSLEKMTRLTLNIYEEALSGQPT